MKMKFSLLLIPTLLSAVFVLANKNNQIIINAETEDENIIYSFDFNTDAFENGWTEVQGKYNNYSWKNATSYAMTNFINNDDKYKGPNKDGKCIVAFSRYITTEIDADDYLFSPSIAIPNCGASFSFYEMRGYSAVGFEDYFAVYIGESKNIEELTRIFPDEGYELGDETWTQVEFRVPSSFCGKNVYFAIEHVGNGGDSLLVDDFVVTKPEIITHELFNPTCESDGHVAYYECEQTYYKDKNCSQLIGDLKAKENWLKGEGKINKTGHNYIDNRCSICKKFDDQFLINNEEGKSLIKGIYSTGENTIDIFETEEVVKENGVALYGFNECVFYRIDNTLYVVSGGSSHDIKLKATLENNKVTKIQKYNTISEGENVVRTYDVPLKEKTSNLTWLWILLAILGLLIVVYVVGFVLYCNEKLPSFLNFLVPSYRLLKKDNIENKN